MTELVIEQPTAEEIAKHYSACLDSCNLLKAGQQDMTDEEWADCRQRNIDHLTLMLAKDFWEGYDLQPLQDAVA